MVVRSEKRWTTAEAAPEVADGIAADYGFSRAMARALVVFRDGLAEAKRLRAEQLEKEAEVARRMVAERHRIADAFMNTMGALAGGFVTSSSEVADAARRRAEMGVVQHHAAQAPVARWPGPGDRLTRDAEARDPLRTRREGTHARPSARARQAQEEPRNR